MPRRRIVIAIIAAAIVLLVAASAWVAVRALLAKDRLEAAVPLTGQVRDQLVAGDSAGARDSLERVIDHARAADELTSDPVFTAATIVPFVGPNLAALASISSVVDDIASDGIRPLLPLAGSLDIATLAPVDGRIDPTPLTDAAPVLEETSEVLDRARAEVDEIDTTGTLDQVSDAVSRLSAVVDDAASALDTASTAARLLPAMLGTDGDRRYLLLFQNNAELRATGGIAGAVALLTTSNGSIALSAQASASDFPRYDGPVLPVDGPSQSLFGREYARYLQNVNFTPEFPEAARLAAEMWRLQFGQDVDGVIAVDPILLGYLLSATGPVTLSTGDVIDADNAVPFLLSDVYREYADPDIQDLVFADAARQVFTALTAGDLDPGGLANALTRGADERRILIWNQREDEQDLLSSSSLAGTLSAAPSSFGVFLNDATAAKMDAYLDVTTAIETDACANDGPTDARAEVQLTSTAPPDASTSLPPYVTGSGAAGVPPGTIRTRLLVYGPEGAVLTGVEQDGAAVAAQIEQHLDRGVAQVVVDLEPGASSLVAVTFELAERPYSATGVVVTPLIRYQEPRIHSVLCR